MMPTIRYRLPEIPDPSDARYRAPAGGDVVRAVWNGSQLLLRSAAELLPGCMSICIRSVFDPAQAPRNPQSRLSFYLCARAIDKATDAMLRAMLSEGPLSHFFPMEIVDKVPFSFEQVSAITHIQRRERLTPPLADTDTNPYVPGTYYACDLFKNNSKGNPLRLDAVLHRVESPVLIDISVEPADVMGEATANARYVDQVKRINQSWIHEDRDRSSIDMFVENGRPASVDKVLPLRTRDPAAESVLRDRQRFHESFKEPHVRFHMVVLAEDEATSRLVASVVADTAFEDGTYQLVTHTGSDVLRSAQKHLEDVRVIGGSEDGVSASIARDAGYTPLARLPHLATVGELCGAFRLPVASGSTPLCIRKSTDPPTPSTGRDFVVFGYEHVDTTQEEAS